MIVSADGSSWELALQTVDVNRASDNPVHSVEPAAARIRSADLYHRRPLWGGDLAITVGYEERDREGALDDSQDVRGFVGWTWEFQ